MAGDDSVRGGVLLVETPGSDFFWQGASGMSDPGTGTGMTPGDQFRSASVGKMFCASAVMMLVEEGEFGLDEAIGQHLPGALVGGLHVLDGRDRGAEITARQLLNHTSGLANYFRLPGFQQMLAEAPDRLWQPSEVIAYVKDQAPPLFEPGGGWHYSDTGYLLLGLIVEHVTGKGLHQIYRERLLEPLGLEGTYMVFREERRPGPVGDEPSHVYLGDLDYTPVRALSADWAGGGLVTTSGDLNRFIRAFAENGVFAKPGTRREMLSWMPTGEGGVYYGLGVRRFMLDELGMRGYGEVWGHSGSSKSFMFYWPEKDTTLCGTLNQDLAEGAWSEALPVAGILPGALREVGQAIGA